MKHIWKSALALLLALAAAGCSRIRLRQQERRRREKHIGKRSVGKFRRGVGTAGDGIRPGRYGLSADL